MLVSLKPQRHLVDHGRVLCPIRGDIDVERCFGCRWLRSVQLTGREPEITCVVLGPSFEGPVIS